MSKIRFHCPICGGGLDDLGQEVAIHCLYCSTSFVVPRELLVACSSMSSEPAPQTGSAAARNTAAGAEPEADEAGAEPEADEAEEELFEDGFSDLESG